MKRAAQSPKIAGIRLPVPEGVLRLPPQVRIFMLLASAATGCLVSVSCQTSGIPGPQTATAPYQSSHWTRVATKPPIYYPQGVDSDSSTDLKSGEWYRLCDAADSRYFIPFKVPDGHNRQRLVNEVCSLRTEDYRRQIAKEDTETIQEHVDSIKRCAKYSPVLVPLNTALVLLGAMTGAGGTGISLVSPTDFERWLQEDGGITNRSNR